MERVDSFYHSRGVCQCVGPLGAHFQGEAWSGTGKVTSFDKDYVKLHFSVCGTPFFQNAPAFSTDMN